MSDMVNNSDNFLNFDEHGLSISSAGAAGGGAPNVFTTTGSAPVISPVDIVTLPPPAPVPVIDKGFNTGVEHTNVPQPTSVVIAPVSNPPSKILIIGGVLAAIGLVVGLVLHHEDKSAAA